MMVKDAAKLRNISIPIVISTEMKAFARGE